MKQGGIQRGPGKQIVNGASFRLMDEVRHMQDRAAEHVGRIVTLGQWVLFSTETGDAWLLDPSDQLPAPLAREGDPLPVHIGETDKSFAIGWAGTYRIDGAAFLYTEGSRRIRTILGYPTRKITRRFLKFQILLARIRKLFSRISLYLARPEIGRNTAKGVSRKIVEMRARRQL